VVWDMHTYVVGLNQLYIFFSLLDCYNQQNTTQKTKDWAIRIPQKKPRCSGWISSSSSASGTRRQWLLFNLFSFLFWLSQIYWPLYCLSVTDLQLLITLLISSTFLMFHRLYYAIKTKTHSNVLLFSYIMVRSYMGLTRGEHASRYITNVSKK
jgi:hypothetical protein